VKDTLAVGLGALACGAGLGGGTIVVTLSIVRTLERHVPAASYEGSAADPVLAAMLAGLAVAAAFGWRRSRALENVSQRGVIAVMAAVGAVLIGFIAWPVDRWLGFTALAAWGAASFLGGAAGSRWATRGSREDAIKVDGE
jgi:hypothetical protein